MEKLKEKTTEKSFLILFILVLLVTIVRPFFIEQDIMFTYYGAVSSLITGAIYLYLANTPSHNWHPYLFAVVSLCLLLPILILTGGTNSHFAPLLPLMPVLFCIIASRRIAQLLTVVLIGYIMTLHWARDILPSYDALYVSKEVTGMRTLWLSLSCLLGILFGMEFDKINRALGTKLLESNSKDALTGIDNRVSVLERLEAKIALANTKNEWLSVFIIEIDDFNVITDTYGHSVRDLALQQVACCIQHSVRGKDDLVGRYGEEKFLLVLQGADQSAAYKIAEKVRRQIEEIELQYEGESVTVSVTIGYCSMPSENIHASEQLLQLADNALIAGRSKGPNLVVGADQAVMTESYVTNG